MTLKLTKHEIISLFEAEKAGLIKSDTLQKIIVAASQGNKDRSRDDTIPKETYKDQDFYSQADAFGHKILKTELKKMSKRSYVDDNICFDEHGNWRYLV